jgi:hypothetical protein
LKDTHEKIDEVPEEFRSLYTEKDGKWEFTGVQGIRTSRDVERVQEALRKEKNDNKELKQQLSVWGDLKHDEVLAKLDKLPELEAASKGKLDENAIEEIVQRRVEGTLKSKLAPVERQNKQLQQQLAEVTEKATTLEGEKKKRTLHDAVRKAARDAKVLPEAEDDVLLWAERVMEISEDGKVVTKDGVGVTPGLEAQAWLSEIQDKKTHWWPGTQGGGAPGSGPRMGAGGPNPWSHDGWNMTQQGVFLRQHGRERAEQMAKAAGTTVGGPQPKPRK